MEQGTIHYSWGQIKSLLLRNQQGGNVPNNNFVRSWTKLFRGFSLCPHFIGEETADQRVLAWSMLEFRGPHVQLNDGSTTFLWPSAIESQ